MSSPAPPKKSLGQHWLRDEEVLNAIADAAEVGADDVVLEIGPGLGTLTKVLVERVKSVIAVEYDPDLARDLPGLVPADNLVVQQADILDYDFGNPPTGYKVVANIPYYLTTHLVRRLLEAENQPSNIALLIQKEVAQRIVAKPGKMSILAVSAQFYADCRLDIEVPAAFFDPPPKVDSQVVVITPKQPPDVDTKAFFRTVKAGFGEKRKKLTNSLSGGLHMDKGTIAGMLELENLNPNARAQELSIEQWLALHERIQQHAD